MLWFSERFFLQLIHDRPTTGSHGTASELTTRHNIRRSSGSQLQTFRLSIAIEEVPSLRVADHYTIYITLEISIYLVNDIER